MPTLPVSLMGLICGKPLGSGSVMCAYLLPKENRSWRAHRGQPAVAMSERTFLGAKMSSCNATMQLMQAPQWPDLFAWSFPALLYGPWDLPVQCCWSSWACYSSRRSGCGTSRRTSTPATGIDNFEKPLINVPPFYYAAEVT